ncbi:hypothetical protein RclHR1_03790010 [Rhizophagus clarus]|uniref:Uncharacterized protein n=1 Tax=Rhizophagus clarus TaxID=94130 RepID=A0A2Z6S7D1_9GLOM|nr:hypothetical protein RclHR1_03790010 [Rhizophagus clarus]GES83586.1 hypothetical protein GLOIN_2v1835987 [Rhizophagus clarus]
MTSNQPNQYYQQSSQESIISHVSHAMNEYRFFYENNDYQIYDILCREISIDQLLNNYNDSIHNYNQPNNIYVFCFQNPIDKKIYRVSCEMMSHSLIVKILNKTLYNIELNLNEHQQQRQQEFSKEHKKNLEFHLKNLLINYMVSEQQICEQNQNLDLNYMQNNFNNSNNASLTLTANNFPNNDDNSFRHESYNCHYYQYNYQQ